MSKPVKGMVVESLRKSYADVDSACVVDLTGLNVQEQEQLREMLRAKSAEMHVVKNSLARRAFAEMPLGPLGTVLEGPCALVTSSAPIIDAAKALVEAAKEFEQLTLKEAISDGDPKLLTVVQLAKMKGRMELMGELAMLISSPGRSIAGCLAGPQAKIAGCLKTLADKAA